LLSFTSHCSTKNIGFNDSRYVSKPPQPSSAIYGAPPFTGNHKKETTFKFEIGSAATTPVPVLWLRI